MVNQSAIHIKISYTGCAAIRHERALIGQMSPVRDSVSCGLKSQRKRPTRASLDLIRRPLLILTLILVLNDPPPFFLIASQKDQLVSLSFALWDSFATIHFTLSTLLLLHDRAVTLLPLLSVF